MKALILAAGYATRLYPLTRQYPKPLLLVRARPIIDYIIEKLEAVRSLDEIIVVTNSKFFAQFKRWKKGLKAKKRLNLIDDLTRDHRRRRGAIGDIDFVIKQKNLKDDLLVIGGDNIFDARLAGFLSFARANKPHPAIGAYDLKNRKQASHYGVIKLDRHNRIICFQEKPRSPNSTLVAMCLYYFPQDKLGLVTEYLKTKTDKHDATGYYIDWLCSRVPVYGFVFPGRWYDIGHHEFYKQAQAEVRIGEAETRPPKRKGF